MEVLRRSPVPLIECAYALQGSIDEDKRAIFGHNNALSYLMPSEHLSMADPFFDLGITLPQVDSGALQAHLSTNAEIFEKAFLPSSVLGSLPAGDVIQFKDKTFKRMRFYETRFVQVIFTGCTFDECLFLGARFEECEFHGCVFIRCNTHKFHLSQTYLDPKSFLKNLFDRKKYANVGVDLFHALMKNSADESQPEFRDTAEYHFRLWQRYNKTHYWQKKGLIARLMSVNFFSYWISDLFFQWVLGYGVQVRNIICSTPVLFGSIWLFNHYNWDAFGFDSSKLTGVSLEIKSAFFTAGVLSTFGTNELNPTTSFGLAALCIEVTLGITWIALSTAMIVKRFIR